jgi:hypothetical protein
LGPREDVFTLGPPSSNETARALAAQLNEPASDSEFAGFLNTISTTGTSASQPDDFPTRGAFTERFRTWGNIVLDSVIAVSISLVYFDPHYKWIQNQQSGVIHNLCHHVYSAIIFVLRAHNIDYPNIPAEQGELPPTSNKLLS